MRDPSDRGMDDELSLGSQNDPSLIPGSPGGRVVSRPQGTSGLATDRVTSSISPPDLFGLKKSTEVHFEGVLVRDDPFTRTQFDVVG